MASTRISLIQGPEGPEGPVGPAGPNTVPTQEAIAAAISTPGTPAEMAVTAKIEAVVGIYAPPPTGIKATDTANVQPLVTLAQNTGGTVFLQAGTYVMDITTAKMERQPRIVGKGEKLTLWNGTLSMEGVPGAFSGGYLSDFAMTGVRASGFACWKIRGVVSLRWDRINFSATADVGIIFENDAQHSFTEMCAGQAHFEQNIKRAIVYNVAAGGNPSFHGCGLTDGSTINQSATDTLSKIDIGPGAEPYNAPMSVTIWARTAVPLIRHRGLPSCTFHGQLKIELLPPSAKAIIVDPTSTYPLPFVGGVERRGKRVERGRLVIGEEAITEGSTAVVRRGGADVASHAPGRVMRIDPDGVPEYVATTRTNRAKNPVAGDGTTYAGGYYSPAIASVTDSALGSAKLWTVTTSGTTNTEGFTYVQPASGLAAGQIKTMSFDILSPVDIIMFVGGRIGLSGSPGTIDALEGATTGAVEYIAANTVQRVRRIVTMPPPNSGGTITHEGFYVRANTIADMPAPGTVIKVGNVVIEDGVTSGSKFYGGDALGTFWSGVAHQSASISTPMTSVSPAEAQYTPTLTGITLGNGVLEAWWSQVGKRVTGSVYIKFGTTTALTGTPGFSLPTPRVSGARRRWLVDGYFTAGGGIYWPKSLPNSVDQINIYGIDTSAAVGKYLALTATVPATFTTNDEFMISFEYEAL